MGRQVQRHQPIANALLGAVLLWLALGLGFVQAEDQVPGPDDQYTLGAGDVIRIHVFGEPDLSFESVLVGESGKVSYPFLGELTVKGLTLAQMDALLLTGLKPDYLIDPKISVSIVAYRPFFISGEVKKPGSYPYQPGLRLRQAISLAEGFTERASQSKIYVVHDNDPSAKRHRVDLGYDVKPGDTITVEESFF
jgi:polysaccharide export outer membrane protein